MRIPENLPLKRISEYYIDTDSAEWKNLSEQEKIDLKMALRAYHSEIAAQVQISYDRHIQKWSRKNTVYCNTWK